MSEREYIVGLHKGVDYDKFNQDMITSTGDGAIPSRAVDVVNARPGSYRLTHYSLTDAEAQELMNDPRVVCVEIPPEQRDDIQMINHAFQSGTFDKTSSSSGDNLNWGLMRCNQDYNNYGTDIGPFESTFDYVLDGRGVDVVIQDSGVEPTHPEWEDKDGNSRYQTIDWYAVSGIVGNQTAEHNRDWDGHGTHVAGIIAGKTFGWAKGANIYSQKLQGLEASGDSGGIPISVAFDAIKLWHRNKPVNPVTGAKRPTVVNMSWGYAATVLERDFDINSFDPQPIITHRGTEYQYGSSITSRNTAWGLAGFVASLFSSPFYTGQYGTPAGFSIRVPIRIASIDLDVQELIDEGVHVCIAAGNTPFKADVFGGVDYDNNIEFPAGASTLAPGTRLFYHRGSSPFSDDAFMVGNIDSTPYNSSEDQLAITSTRGPAINIMAPGTEIKSSCSNINTKNAVDYYADPGYKQVNIGGTSMAAPQVAGVVACYAQLNPDYSPAQMQDQIFKHTSPTVISLGNDSNYNAFSIPFLIGTPNRMLRQKFNAKVDGTMGGGIQLNGCVVTQA